MSKDNGPNLSQVKIEAIHCYACANQFQKSGRHEKTMHHAIPRFHKPKRNILLPVCKECHQMINKFTVQSIPKLDALDNFINSMDQFLKKYKKVMKRHEGEEPDD